MNDYHHENHLRLPMTRAKRNKFLTTAVLSYVFTFCPSEPFFYSRQYYIGIKMQSKILVGRLNEIGGQVEKVKRPFGRQQSGPITELRLQVTKDWQLISGGQYLVFGYTDKKLFN